MNIIPFESKQLPAHLQTAEAAVANTDLTAHAGTGFPVISIKGKAFTIVREGERKIIPNPKDPESPANSIEMVLVKANKLTSKVYYINGYVEGGEAKKPDCYSTDGIRPMDDSEYKQNPICGTCRHNQWGSKVSDDGKGRKGKACQDAVRLAVAHPMMINDPYLLRVPPASIRAVGELGSMLSKRGVSYQSVIVRIGFVAESATPELTFKPVGFLDAEAYAKVQDIAQSEVVQAILGINQVAVAPVEAPITPPPVIKPDRTVTQEEVAAAIATAKGKTAPKVDKPIEAAPTANALGGFALDLGNLKFDD